MFSWLTIKQIKPGDTVVGVSRRKYLVKKVTRQCLHLKAPGGEIIKACGAQEFQVILKAAR
jgi:hypothetical protein